MKLKEVYEAPLVEVVEVMVEKGYATSGGFGEGPGDSGEGWPTF